jgi:hypothetical protein
MLENLNSGFFSQHLHTTFQVRAPGSEPLSFELIEVAEKNESPRVEQFSLIFRGPVTPHLPQAIYTFEHEKMGTFDLFVVPLGPDSAGMSYQVVFNRLRRTSSHPA